MDKFEAVVAITYIAVSLHPYLFFGAILAIASVAAICYFALRPALIELVKSKATLAFHSKAKKPAKTRTKRKRSALRYVR